jgi:hypothetical protein
MPLRLPPLLPEPRRVEPRAGHLGVSAQTPVVLAPGSDDGDLASARLLADGLAARAGRRPPIESHTRSADLGPRLELRRGGRSGDGYRIDASAEKVVLEGDGPAGLRYAAQTLLQLVDARGRIPACRIEDAPDFPLRGLMLDVSRGKVPTQACLEELVDRCGLLKLNVLMLYVEHPFRFRRHPEIGANASPLDAETLRQLDAYAAARHVQLVPSLQSLGHMEHVLKLPRYAGLAESDARWSLAPVDPGAYALLEDLYDEYLPNFRSAYFNANCDEPWDLGYGRSKERAQEIGRGGVFLEHVRKVRDLAARHGRRTLVWADVVHTHPDRVPEIDRDLVLLDWWYEADHDYDRVKVFAENGLDFWVCPGTSSWNCLFPRMENALANITPAAATARAACWSRTGATSATTTCSGTPGSASRGPGSRPGPGTRRRRASIARSRASSSATRVARRRASSAGWVRSTTPASRCPTPRRSSSCTSTTWTTPASWRQPGKARSPTASAGWSGYAASWPARARASATTA